MGFLLEQAFCVLFPVIHPNTQDSSVVLNTLLLVEVNLLTKGDAAAKASEALKFGVEVAIGMHPHEQLLNLRPAGSLMHIGEYEVLFSHPFNIVHLFTTMINF
jgi:hypothetical protein